MSNWIYPYNFVRLDREVDQAPPPSWERYQDCSGRIECSLTNLTAMFIPDRGRTGRIPLGEDKFHKIAGFFRIGERLGIPSTSIRGMIRNVVEAVTNSCLSTFADPGEDEQRDRLLWRRDRGFGPGDHFSRVEGQLIYKDGAWQLREKNVAKLPIYVVDQLFAGQPYPNMTNPTTVMIQKTMELQRGAPIIVQGTIGGTPFSLENRTAPFGTVQGRAVKMKWPDGTSLTAGCPSSLNPIDGTNVTDITAYKTYSSETKELWRVASLTSAGQQRIVNSSTAIFSGVLIPPPDFQVRGGPPDEKFQNLRFHRVLYPINGQKRIFKGISTDLIQELAWIAKDRYTKPLKNNRKSELDFKEMEGWNGKYVVAQIRNRDEQLVALGPVAMFLEYFQRHPKKLLTDFAESLLPCKDATQLCPACRLFGMIGDSQSYAGRISFEPGYSNLESNPYSQSAPTRFLPLRILGNPKPTYFPFYLQGNNGLPVDYSGEQPGNPVANQTPMLRGRKFYWHQSPAADPGKYGIQSERFEKKPKNFPYTTQNVTAEILTRIGTAFNFTVTFENLTQEELGLLLWSLELPITHPDGENHELAHKIGHARPLGLGSVKIAVRELWLYDNDFDKVAGENASSLSKDDYVQKFRESLGGSNFHQLPRIRDLTSLLSWTKRPQERECQHGHYYVSYLPAGEPADRLPEILKKRRNGQRPEPHVLEDPALEEYQ